MQPLGQRLVRVPLKKRPARQPAAPPNYYDLLGLRPGASPQDIRRAYRDLSKLYHPDTTQLERAIATAKFQALNEAYATLSSPEKRLTYDYKIGYSRLSVIQPLSQSAKPSAEHPTRQIQRLLRPDRSPSIRWRTFCPVYLGHYLYRLSDFGGDYQPYPRRHHLNDTRPSANSSPSACSHSACSHSACGDPRIS